MGSNPVQAWTFFRPYFHCCLRSFSGLWGHVRKFMQFAFNFFLICLRSYIIFLMYRSRLSRICILYSDFPFWDHTSSCWPRCLSRCLRWVSYILFEQLNSFLHSFIQYVFLIEQFNILYNPVINFCTDLSATLHHVAQITGKLSHIISRPLIFPRFH